MNLKRLLVLSIILSVVTSCGVPAELKNYYSHNVESDLTPSKWPENSFPIALRLSNDFDSNEKSAIAIMSDKWTDSTKTSTAYFNSEDIASSENDFPNLDAYNDNIMGVYKITNWDSELPATALAVTQLFGTHHGTHIVIEHADILVNYDNFEFSSQGGFGYDLSTVVLHELGHFLGLYHEKGFLEDSIMYPSISRFDIRRDPYAYDIDNIQNKYSFTYAASSSHKNLVNSLPDQSDKSGVVIRLELNADGKCTHRINGKVNHEH